MPKKSTSLAPRPQRFLLPTALLCHAVGMSLACLRASSPLASYLFLEQDWQEASSLAVDQLMAGLILGCALACYWRPTFLPFLVISLWAFINTLVHTFFGGGFIREISLFAHSAYYLGPLLIGLIILGQRQALPPAAARQGLRSVIALTFAAHGLEALLAHPQFIDYLISASRKLWLSPLEERQAVNFLLLVGSLDLLAAFVVFTRWQKQALLYMAVWGLITACVRLIDSPNFFGLEQTLIRLIHSVIPFYLYHGLQGQSTIAKFWQQSLSNMRRLLMALIKPLHTRSGV